MLGCVTLSAAQDRQPAELLHVVVSNSGRAIFDNLLDAMATGAGLARQMSVKYADPLNALRSFCQNGNGSPDIVLATHRMQLALAAECAKNGMDEIAAVELGRNALILAVRSGSNLSSLTSRQVYLAIAGRCPRRGIHPQHHRSLVDVDPSLPVQDISFQLPMRDDGSRAMFESLVLERGCRNEGGETDFRRAAALRAVYDDTVRPGEGDAARPGCRTLLEAPIGTVGVLSQREVIQSGGQLVGPIWTGCGQARMPY